MEGVGTLVLDVVSFQELLCKKTFVGGVSEVRDGAASEN